MTELVRNCNGMWLPATDIFFRDKPDYELDDYNVVLNHVKSKRCAVDIGAHVGFWTQRLVKDFNVVHAFEPVNSHLDCLKRNVQSHNLFLHDLSLSDRDGYLNFTVEYANSGMSRVSEQGQKIKCQTLDYYQLLDVDLIKLDVEGHERRVLEGAQETILRCRPALIIEMFVHGSFEDVQKIFHLLEKWNYVLKTRISYNHIFLANDKDQPTNPYKHDLEID